MFNFNPDWLCRVCDNQQMAMIDELWTVESFDPQESMGIQWCIQCGTVQLGEETISPKKVELENA